MTLKNNRAHLLSNIKFFASFHHHMWIPTGITVRKRLSWVLTSVTLTFDLWPQVFAWTSLLSKVITPENFMMIRWEEHCKQKVSQTERTRQTDGQTDWNVLRAASKVAAKKTPRLRFGVIMALSLVYFLFNEWWRYGKGVRVGRESPMIMHDVWSSCDRSSDQLEKLMIFWYPSEGDI